MAELLRQISDQKSGDRRYRSGQDLFGLGASSDAVYYLVDGWAFLYNVLENGRRQILHFALPGSVLGLPMAEGAILAFGAQALTDVVASVIPHKALYSLSIEHPEIGLQLASLISRDVNLAFAHLTSIGRQSARARVARLLLELFLRCRSVWPENGIEAIHLPLTQEHIADATGLAAVHVNRVLRGLARDGVAEFHYRRLQVLDPDKLIDAAGIDPRLAMPWLRRGPPK